MARQEHDFEPPEGAPMDALGRMVHAFATLEGLAHVVTWALMSDDPYIGYCVTRHLSSTRLATLQRELVAEQRADELPEEQRAAIVDAARDLERLAVRRNRATHARWVEAEDGGDDPDTSPGGLIAFPNADFLRSLANPQNWRSEDDADILTVAVRRVDEGELESLTAETNELASRYLGLFGGSGER